MADDRDPPEWAMREASSYLAKLFIIECDYSRLSSIEYEQKCLALLARIYAAARAEGWCDAIEAAAQAIDQDVVIGDHIRALADPGPRGEGDNG